MRHFEWFLACALILSSVPTWAQGPAPSAAPGTQVGPPVASAPGIYSSSFEGPCWHRPSACDTACCEDCCEECCTSWYAQFDALYLNRTNTDMISQSLIFVPTQTTIFTTDDLDLGSAPGGRILLGYHDCCGRGWELLYYGTDDWTSATTFQGQLSLPGALGAAAGFNLVGQLDTQYSSQLHNVEINRVFGSLPFSVLAGFRYVELDEQFSFAASLNAPGNVVSGRYDIDAVNRLYGAQIGTRLTHRWERWGFDFTAKAGVFANDADQSSNIVVAINNASASLPPGTGSTTDVAFVGDINLSGAYRLLDNVWLRGGYNFMWIEGIALGPDQLDFTLSPTSRNGLNNDGGVYLHGANAGVEVRW